MEVLEMLELVAPTTSKSRRSISFQKQEEGNTTQESCGPSAGVKRHRVLVPREKAEPYLTGNPYTTDSYRKCENVWEALDGLFYLHNQSVDTWTSILSIVHSTLCYSYAVDVLDVFAMGTAPAVIFTLFWLHVIIHGPASASCHLIGNAGISKYWYDLTLQADYQCIFIASTLLSITLSYWVFPIEGTLAISLLAIAMTVHLAFNLKEVVADHHQRLIMLMGIGNLYQIPMIYQGIKDWRAAAVGSPLPYTMVCALVVFVSLCGGGLVYAFHLPERWCKPGRFNLFNSHGIMHVLIQVAHFFEFTFLVHMCLRREQEMLAY